MLRFDFSMKLRIGRSKPGRRTSHEVTDEAPTVLDVSGAQVETFPQYRFLGFRPEETYDE